MTIAIIITINSIVSISLVNNALNFINKNK